MARSAKFAYQVAREMTDAGFAVFCLAGTHEDEPCVYTRWLRVEPQAREHVKAMSDQERAALVVALAQECARTARRAGVRL